MKIMLILTVIPGEDGAPSAAAPDPDDRGEQHGGEVKRIERHSEQNDWQYRETADQ